MQEKRKNKSPYWSILWVSLSPPQPGLVPAIPQFHENIFRLFQKTRSKYDYYITVGTMLSPYSKPYPPLSFTSVPSLWLMRVFVTITVKRFIFWYRKGLIILSYDITIRIFPLGNTKNCVISHSPVKRTHNSLVKVLCNSLLPYFFVWLTQTSVCIEMMAEHCIWVCLVLFECKLLLLHSDSHSSGRTWLRSQNCGAQRRRQCSRFEMFFWGLL